MNINTVMNTAVVGICFVVFCFVFLKERYFSIQCLESNEFSYFTSWHRHRPREVNERPAQPLSCFFLLLTQASLALASASKTCSHFPRNNTGRKHVFLHKITRTQEPYSKINSSVSISHPASAVEKK